MNNISLNDIDLNGVIDMHIHTSPDICPRYSDDIQAAREAKEAGMKAILLKSHITLTADRAAIAEKVVEGIHVFGGIVLNSQVGGLNPAAVDTALKMGAREIWMPTLDAANNRLHDGKNGGISIFSNEKEVYREIYEIIDLIHQSNAILATGHLSIEETIALVKLARQHGLRKILITHPDSPLTRMPIETQMQISGEEVYFERCFVETTSALNCELSIREIANSIRSVGINSTVLTTDFGLANLPSPVDGMRDYLSQLSNEGFSPDELRVMASEIPSTLLNL
jgi:hypothetical protein